MIYFYTIYYATITVVKLLLGGWQEVDDLNILLPQGHRILKQFTL